MTLKHRLPHTSDNLRVKSLIIHVGVWILIRFSDLTNINYAIPLESRGGEEVMVNLWNFAPSKWPSARFMFAPSTHSLLWLGRCPSGSTHTAVCSRSTRAVRVSGFWLGSNRLPHRVSNFTKASEPWQQSHTESETSPGACDWSRSDAWGCPSI